MKVGLCGLGERLSYLAQTLCKLIPGFDIVAFVDPNGIRANTLHGLDRRPVHYGELGAMLAAEKLDLLMIGSPNFMHLEHIKQGLDAGVRIFVEKPLVISEAQTYALLEAIRGYGERDRILVGMVLRYAPIYRDVRRLVSEGALGPITSIEASEHIAPEHGAFFMRDWRRHHQQSGGFLLEKCCHDLDVYQSLVGARPQRVVSFGGRKTFTPQNRKLEGNPVYHQRASRWGGSQIAFDDDTDLIDYQTALIEYENGSNLCFHTNLNAPDEYRHFSIFGVRGMAEGDFVRNFLRVHQAPTTKTLVDKSYAYDDGVSVHYGAEARMAVEWQRYFETGRALPVSVIDALEAGLTAIKLDESRLTGRIVELSETWERFDSYRVGPASKTPAPKASMAKTTPIAHTP